MMKKIGVRILNVVIFLVFLVSCQNVSDIQIENSEKEQCMSPLFSGQYPHGENQGYSIRDIEQEPNKPWQKLNVEGEIPDGIIQTLFAVTDRGEDTMLWVDMLNDKTASWIFLPYQNKWFEIMRPESRALSVKASPDQSFLGFNKSEVYVFHKEGYIWVPILDIRQFNEKSEFQNLIPRRDGKVWFITFSQSEPPELWLYTPETKEFLGQSLDGYAFGAAIDSKDNLLLVIDEKLIRFDKTTLKPELLALPVKNSRRGGTELYYDSFDRLWINNQVWFDATDSDNYLQYVIIQPSIFISDKNYGENAYTWDNANPMAVTDDGRVWFKSLRGLSWFQPETGEWCMFSSSQSNILKDSDGNLWMVYDNGLYMLPASETSKK